MVSVQGSGPVRRIGVGEVSLSALERRYVNEALDADRLSYGPFSRRFEDGLAAAHGARHAVLANSGTSALHVAVLALKERCGWAEGDEVIVPAVTFPATVNVVLMAGLRPVFVDVSATAYTMAPELIEAAVTPRTRAVMPVHLCGLPADMPAVMEICRRRGLRVIEDSCEAMFASIGGKQVGGFADIGCFSMYAAHILVTGVGGVAVTDDEDLAVIMRSLCNHGRDPVYLAIDDGLGVSGQDLRAVIEGRFRFVRPGASYRITELEAAIGVAQLERRAGLLAARARNAAALTQGLRDLEDAGLVQLPSAPPRTDHVFMFYPLVMTADDMRGGDVAFFLEQRGIETRPLMPLVGQPVYADLFAGAGSPLPVARWLDERAFCIGCHPGLGQEDVEYMTDALRSCLTSMDGTRSPARPTGVGSRSRATGTGRPGS